MQSLNFDDGFKEYMINNDPNKIVRFNPSDFGMLERIKEANRNIDNAFAGVGDIELNPDGTPITESATDAVIEAGRIIKQQIDFVLGSEVSEIVFGCQSPLSSVKGKPLFERFLECVFPVIEKEIEKERKASEASAKRREKYVGMIK